MGMLELRGALRDALSDRSSSTDFDSWIGVKHLYHDSA